MSNDSAAERLAWVLALKLASFEYDNRGTLTRDEMIELAQAALEEIAKMADEQFNFRSEVQAEKTVKQ
jgi:hypothetical protein